MNDILDLEALRADTPGCAHHVHLNNAGSSLMPAPVVRTIQEHIALESTLGGYEAAADRREAIAAAYAAVAGLIGARADQIAFTESATAAYMQALSSIPFTADDVIVTTRNDYVSNQIQFLALQARFGIRVIRAPDLPQGGVDTSAAVALIGEYRPKLVCVTHVPTNSGLVQDVATIGTACREAGSLYLVDACQSVGQMPLDVQRLGCDFLAATFRKFIRGPRGAGFLYVSDRVFEQEMEPLFIDMRGAEWISADRYRAVKGATRFETAEFAWALVLGAGEAAVYAQRVGIERISVRVRRLAARLREGLQRIDGVRVLDRGPELCGIVSLVVETMEARHVAAALRQRGIHASTQFRAYALLDYDDKGVTSSVRLSPHYYNTEAELDRTLDVLADLRPAP